MSKHSKCLLRVTSKPHSRGCIDQGSWNCLSNILELKLQQWQRWKFQCITTVGYSKYRNCEHRKANFPLELTQLYLWVINGCYVPFQLTVICNLEGGWWWDICLLANGSLICECFVSVCPEDQSPFRQAHFSTATDIHKTAVSAVERRALSP